MSELALRFVRFLASTQLLLRAIFYALLIVGVGMAVASSWVGAALADELLLACWFLVAGAALAFLAMLLALSSEDAGPGSPPGA